MLKQNISWAQVTAKTPIGIDYNLSEEKIITKEANKGIRFTPNKTVISILLDLNISKDVAGIIWSYLCCSDWCNLDMFDPRKYKCVDLYYGNEIYSILRRIHLSELDDINLTTFN